jgi:hypothetical protein
MDVLDRYRMEREQARILADALAANPSAVMPRRKTAMEERDYDRLRGIGLAGRPAYLHRALAGMGPTWYGERQREREHLERAGRRSGTRNLTSSQILRKSAGRCYICGIPLSVQTMQWEHVIPLSLGGAHSDENLMAACDVCNSRKGTQFIAFSLATRKPIFIPA